jgi:hypothetical protein
MQRHKKTCIKAADISAYKEDDAQLTAEGTDGSEWQKPLVEASIYKI